MHGGSSKMGALTSELPYPSNQKVINYVDDLNLVSLNFYQSSHQTRKNMKPWTLALVVILIQPRITGEKNLSEGWFTLGWVVGDTAYHGWYHSPGRES